MLSSNFASVNNTKHSICNTKHSSMDYFELLKGGGRRNVCDDEETLDPSISLKFLSYLLCHVEDYALNLQDSVKRLSKFAGRKVETKEALIFISKFHKKFLVKNVDGTRYIEAKTDVTLCDAFQSGKCKNESCKRLHICRFFLQGSCKFDEKCSKGHSFTSPQALNVLVQNKLHGLPLDALRNLFKNVLDKKKMRHASQSSGAPKPCAFYNKESGCKNGDKCSFLHVCEHFIAGKCSFGDQKCKRDHHFDTSHSKKILAAHGLGHLRNQEAILVLRSRTKSDGACSLDSDDDVGLTDTPKPKASSPSVSTPAEDKLEICGFNLRGKCSYGDKCYARHTGLPYQWEYSNAGQIWSCFEDVQNKSIEKAFCDYLQSSVQVTTNERLLCLLDFQTLTGKLHQPGQGPESGVTIKIRRISTVSSVAAAEGHVFRTKWKWYWQDDNDQWWSYDDTGTDTNSEKIELDYLSDSVDKQHSFTYGHHKYYIYMNDPSHLYQQNIEYKTKRDVRRRPARFVDKEVMRKMLEEFKLIKHQMSTSSNGSGQASSVPRNWTPLDPNEEFQIITVNVTNNLDYDEYSEIKQLFEKTTKEHSIKSIKRVQNIGLWEDFQRQKLKISKKNSGSMPEERWLFHGTNEDTVQPICQQGFDWRLSGKHGTRYGKGSYFSTNASYSHNYTRPASSSSGAAASSGTSRMFVAKVIVGSYVVGDYQTTRPPPKDKSDRLSPLHDSCVDNLSNPTIFVVFERSQAYPYYIIEYQ